MSLLRLSLSETVEYLFIKWNASIGRLPQRPSNEGKHLTPANINAGAFVKQIVLSVPYKDPIRSQFLAISLLLVSRSANLRVTKHEIYNLIIQLFSFYDFDKRNPITPGKCILMIWSSYNAVKYCALFHMKNAWGKKECRS